ncbi:MAG TPA: tetratricopeptide repeat protein [Aestuariivirgaceae bacterium]|nr:tetratricopeptide repeat protein [Aestuariivirgaceae bacterium]
MSLTLLGWVFIVSSIAVLLLFLLRSRGLRREQLDLETCNACLEDIGAQLKLGKLNEAEADAARLALLSRLRSSSWGLGQYLQSTRQTLVVAAAIFLLVSGIGAAISYVGNPPEATRAGETISFSGPDGEMLSRLTDYARSIGTEQPSSMTAAGTLLPDVNTMIERLAARLETAPQDIEGWRMLGWSYFHTARYEQAATAFGRALELDPSSAELKLSYEEAKAKAFESDNLEIASSLQTEAVDKSGDGLSVESEAMPPRERDAAIRSMVDGLAHRLESSPRDVEGWIRLMRSRVVLGEREVAATAFRKALEVFMDDSAASGKIKAAAIELGLKAE